jgi:phenylalanyl-tRNA synthetase beta chain
MKFTLSWLKQHLATTATLDEICVKLTAIGLEVESVTDRSAALAPFKIAYVADAVQHPQADRLRVLTVDTGKEKLQVVCGAPNARAGMKTVLALPGDVIPASGEMLKKGVIRGVESQGMCCSADELGLQELRAEGILDLPSDAPLGASYVDWAGLNDPVIEINLTPNRADCAGVYGIARDLAAAGLGTLQPLQIAAVKGTFKSAISVELRVASCGVFSDSEPVIRSAQPNLDGTPPHLTSPSRGEEQAVPAASRIPHPAVPCPLFVGRLIRNIKNGPSPDWLQRQLQAIGLRPISAMVDITNYLTFDQARPLHVFDAAKVSGNLWVTPAKGGEELVALNGKTYTLESGMTAIGDATGVLSLAGIMGGAATGCDTTTTSVFIESALFDPVRTAQTGRALGVHSDARYRFERGVDPNFAVPGMELATRLVLELCGTAATEVSELVIAGAVPDAVKTITYDPATCRQLIGVEVAVAEQAKILRDLGFKVQDWPQDRTDPSPLEGEARWGGEPLSTAASSGGTPPSLALPTGGSEQPFPRQLLVSVPTWRPDIDGQADLAEEVIRIKGFEHIPAVSLPRDSVMTPLALDLPLRRAHAARRALAGQGLMEAVTWSFMASSLAEQFGSTKPQLRLVNPISADLDMMRPSILGNLLTAAQRNADRGFGDVGLFEIGPVFQDTTPDGQIMMAAALRAGQTPRHWQAKPRAVDAYDAKADALAALAACGAPTASLQVTTDAPAWYHPGRSGVLRLGPTALAAFGELHPALLAAVDSATPVVAMEIYLANLPVARTSGTAKPLLKLDALQPLTRDFAFVVDRSLTAEKLVKAVKGAEKNLIREVTVFDVYAGDKIAADKKSLALSVTLQPKDKTLTDADIDTLSQQIVKAAEKVGASLRA